MQDMSKEMMKAGIIEEMLEDTMEVLEPEDIEEEAESEVDKVGVNLHFLQIKPIYCERLVNFKDFSSFSTSKGNLGFQHLILLGVE